MLIGATLGRYFSVQFLKTILMVFGTVFSLVYTIDFVELMRRAGDAEGASAGLMALLALYRTPSVAEQVLPFAVLFGSMAALLQLSRKLELVVARAAGISAWQFLQPGLLVAAVIGVAVLRITGFAASNAAVRTPMGVFGIYGTPLLAMAISTALIFQGALARSLGARVSAWLSALPLPRLPGLRRA